jgi:hypothetical protein
MEIIKVCLTKILLRGKEANSIRAWRPRRLGPQAQPNLQKVPDQTKDGLFDYSIEKPSTILLEGSIELEQRNFLDL